MRVWGWGGVSMGLGWGNEGEGWSFGGLSTRMAKVFPLVIIPFVSVF